MREGRKDATVEYTGGTLEQLPTIPVDDDHVIGEALALSTELSVEGRRWAKFEGYGPMKTAYPNQLQ